jgi:hypothetical protein
MGASTSARANARVVDEDVEPADDPLLDAVLAVAFRRDVWRISDSGCFANGGQNVKQMERRL